MLGGLGEVISNAGNAVKDMVDTGLDAAKDNVSTITGGVKDIFPDDLGVLDKLKDAGSSLLDGGLDVLTGEGSVGEMISGTLDSVGVPDWAADIIGAVAAPSAESLEQLLSGAGGLAGELGAEELGGFLDVAGDKVGMMTDVAGDIVFQVANAKTGGTLGKVRQGQELLKGIRSGDLSGQAGNMAGLGKMALGGLGGGAGEMGTGLFDMMEGSTSIMGDVAGGGGGLASGLTGILGDSGGMMGQILGAFGGETGVLSELPIGEILSGAGIGGSESDPLAGAVAGLAGELGGIFGGDTGPPGTALLNSDAAGDLVGVIAQGIGGNNQEQAMGFLEMAMQISAGWLDMADADADVAGQVVETLAQMGSMSQSSAVSDMLGAQMRV